MAFMVLRSWNIATCKFKKNVLVFQEFLLNPKGTREVPTGGSFFEVDNSFIKHKHKPEVY